MLVELRGDGPVSQRVYRGLRRAIIGGRLERGARLPSTRSLASDLGVSRKAVALAFERLADEGYVEARVGSGTFVAATVQDVVVTPREPERRAANAAPAPVQLSVHARRVVAQSPWPPPGAKPQIPLRCDFHYGTTAFSDFPQASWSRLVAERARRLTVRTLGYGRTVGYPPLRRAIAQHVARCRGVVASEEQVIVVSGSQQAIDLLVRLLVDPGDRVVIEEPGYQGARQVLVAAGAEVVPVAVDDEGLDVSKLPRTQPVRMAYVTPSHHFPLGGILPRERRLELLRWAHQVDAFVIEDDYDSEFRYEGHPVEAVQALDRDGRVLYVGTFSKVLFPSIRMAYLVLPPALVPIVASLKFLTDCHSPTFEQAVLADFMNQGHFDRHLRRARVRNARRREALLEALALNLGDRVQVAGANAGVHVVAWIPDLPASRVGELRRRAATAGVGIYPVSPYYVQPPQQAGLVFGYASLDEREIHDGIKVLGQVLDSFSMSREQFRAD